MFNNIHYQRNANQNYNEAPSHAKIEKDTYTPMFIAALFTTARTWQQRRCPSADKWIRTLWYTYTMEYSVQFSSVQ